MRRLGLVAVVLLATACRTRIALEREPDFYVGAGAWAVPDVGAALVAGQYVDRSSPRFDFGVEVQIAYQGGEDSATQTGRFGQFTVGVKQTANPGHRSRWFLRYGITWFRATGRPRVLDQAGDYLGGYIGFGWEFEIVPGLRTGPEARLVVADGEGSLGTEVLPQFGWSLVFDF